MQICRLRELESVANIMISFVYNDTSFVLETLVFEIIHTVVFQLIFPIVLGSILSLDIDHAALSLLLSMCG